ncbi:hypothetical protein [Nostoc sp. CENA543]|uniref:hypothetical protein n=1 Tax=Nostoc sp. CENA543 TaxID=1869241 RepID=UPI0013000520|nr:hypothetical protein [Nostoc sp. CENA543]
MTYIDCREERDFTVEELTALLTRTAKPYPNSWYESPQSRITSKNASQWINYQELTTDQLEEDNCYEEFCCPLHRWEYLTCAL